MKKIIIKEKCGNCKKRNPKYRCHCSLIVCIKCSDNGEYCPYDENIEHFLEKLK